jgi:hypothetical protein
LTLVHALQAFFVDMKFQIALVVIFVDFVLGVIAALKLATFRLSYIMDFGRNDVLFKLVPWLVIYVASKFAGHQQLVIPGIDLGVAAGAVYVAMLAAWTGSILTSLSELGFSTVDRSRAALATRYGKFPLWAAGPENAAPPKD